MNSKAEKQNSGSSDSFQKPDPPKRWWQWLLVYPGLAVSIIGAIPTYMEAFKSYNLGVPFGSSFDAQEQTRLWQENFECAKKANFSTTINKNNVEIGSTVCESGDVLLRGKRPEWNLPQLRWVSWDEVAPSDKTSKDFHTLFYINNLAYAGESDRLVLTQAPTSVLCQRWVGPGRLLQRIGTNRGCFDQVINTYNGWIISIRQAPCNPHC